MLPCVCSIIDHMTSKCGKNKKVAHKATEDEKKTKKKPFDVIYDLYKMKQFHWLLCIARNCDSSRKITPLSNLTRASFPVE